MEHSINGCVSNTLPSKYFPQEFLNDPIFQLLPDGFDVCYKIVILQDAIHIDFYLYDSTVPLKSGLNNDTQLDVISSISIYFNIPYKWSYNWTPLYYNILHIPELWTNSDLEGFNSRGGGFGTFMILCVMAYSKSMNLHFATLYDASDGYRKDYNIYLKSGFHYINEHDTNKHDMIGNVNEIYSKISDFIINKGNKVTEKLNKITEYFDDEEWTEDMSGGYKTKKKSKKKPKKKTKKKTKKKLKKKLKKKSKKNK